MNNLSSVHCFRHVWKTKNSERTTEILIEQSPKLSRGGSGHLIWPSHYNLLDRKINGRKFVITGRWFFHGIEYRVNWFVTIFLWYISQLQYSLRPNKNFGLFCSDMTAILSVSFVIQTHDTDDRQKTSIKHFSVWILTSCNEKILLIPRNAVLSYIYPRQMHDVEDLPKRNHFFAGTR